MEVAYYNFVAEYLSLKSKINKKVLRKDRWMDRWTDSWPDRQRKAISIIPHPLSGRGLKSYCKKLSHKKNIS